MDPGVVTVKIGGKIREAKWTAGACAWAQKQLGAKNLQEAIRMLDAPPTRVTGPDGEVREEPGGPNLEAIMIWLAAGLRYSWRDVTPQAVGDLFLPSELGDILAQLQKGLAAALGVPEPAGNPPTMEPTTATSTGTN
ncbi:MAG: hypothetical protein NZM12_10935 [Steroidobacteraceae bacterium]|nr:hypothetical protein [Steroidobacteraceae bacterium]MDW8260768.1 hypothetical protein [Gammaproteobacteria bacterium]